MGKSGIPLPAASDAANPTPRSIIMPKQINGPSRDARSIPIPFPTTPLESRMILMISEATKKMPPTPHIQKVRKPTPTHTQPAIIKPFCGCEPAPNGGAVCTVSPPLSRCQHDASQMTLMLPVPPAPGKGWVEGWAGRRTGVLEWRSVGWRLLRHVFPKPRFSMTPSLHSPLPLRQILLRAISSVDSTRSSASPRG